MKRAIVVAAALACVYASPAHARGRSHSSSSGSSGKHCSKGQPCGNSCISWSATCHIPTYKQPDGTTSRTAPDASAKPLDSADREVIKHGASRATP